MSRFLDPTGRATYGIGICGRSGKKVFLDELVPDPNVPGLMVCRDWADEYDPYRLPPRKADQIALPFTRPAPSQGLNQAGLISERGTEFIVTEDNNKYLEA